MLLMIYGDDAFRVKERAHEFVEKFVEKHDPTRLNCDEIVFGKKDDLDLPRAANAIAASPFLAQRRMVRIDGMFSCVTTKPDAEPWIKLFAAIPDSTIVVLVDATSVDRVEKTELWKRISPMRDAHCYPMPMLVGAGLAEWIQQRAKVYGAVLVPAIANELVLRVGANTWQLENEIAKLAAYANGAPVDSNMIASLVVVEHKEDMFGMIDAFSGGRAAYALQKLSQERSAGTDDFPLFGMLARQVRLLLQAKAYVDEHPHAGKQDIATAFSIHPFVAQKVLAEAGRYSFAKIRAWHSLVAELDVAMKRGVSPDIAVDRLVAALLDGS